MVRREKQKRTGRGITLLGTLAGAAVGAAVGLVYTPTTGEKNRERLNKWASNRVLELENKAKEVLSGTAE